LSAVAAPLPGVAEGELEEIETLLIWSVVTGPAALVGEPVESGRPEPVLEPAPRLVLLPAGVELADDEVRLDEVGATLLAGLVLWLEAEDEDGLFEMAKDGLLS